MRNDGWMDVAVVEDYVHAGFPRDSAAVLLWNVEGLREAAETQAEAVGEVCDIRIALW